MKRSLFAVSGFMFLPAAAGACPRCAIGRAAWNDVLTHHFALNLCVAALPFLLIVLTCISTEVLAVRPDRVVEGSRDQPGP